MNYVKQNYERFADSLQTSEEILFAIEQVAGENFEYEYVAGDFGLPTEQITENAAYGVWAHGGWKDEILAALPTEDADCGDAVSWGFDGIFAEFDGEKWISNSVKFGIFNKIIGEFITVNGETPTPENIRKFDSHQEAQDCINENIAWGHLYDARKI